MRSVFQRIIRQAARIRYRLLLVNVIVVAVPIVGMAFAGEPAPKS